MAATGYSSVPGPIQTETIDPRQQTRGTGASSKAPGIPSFDALSAIKISPELEVFTYDKALKELNSEHYHQAFVDAILLFTYAGFNPETFYMMLQKYATNAGLSLNQFKTDLIQLISYYLARGTTINDRGEKYTLGDEGKARIRILIQRYRIQDNVPASRSPHIVTLGRIMNTFPEIVCTKVAQGLVPVIGQAGIVPRYLSCAAGAALIPADPEFDPLFERYLDYAVTFYETINSRKRDPNTKVDQGAIKKDQRFWSSIARRQSKLTDDARIDLFRWLAFDFDQSCLTESNGIVKFDLSKMVLIPGASFPKNSPYDGRPNIPGKFRSDASQPKSMPISALAPEKSSRKPKSGVEEEEDMTEEEIIAYANKYRDEWDMDPLSGNIPKLSGDIATDKEISSPDAPIPSLTWLDKVAPFNPNSNRTTDPNNFLRINDLIGLNTRQPGFSFSDYISDKDDRSKLYKIAGRYARVHKASFRPPKGFSPFFLPSRKIMAEIAKRKNVPVLGLNVAFVLQAADVLWDNITPPNESDIKEYGSDAF